MSGWKDETSYTRGAKQRIPAVLSMGLPGNVKLIVHRMVGAAQETWFYTLRSNSQPIVQDVELLSTNLDNAKSEALFSARLVLLKTARMYKDAAEEVLLVSMEGVPDEEVDWSNAKPSIK